MKQKLELKLSVGRRLYEETAHSPHGEGVAIG